MMDAKPDLNKSDKSKLDPVMQDLARFLKENLPPDIDEAKLFRNVQRISKVFDLLIGLSFEEFYTHVRMKQQEANEGRQETVPTLEETVNERLKEMKEYLNLNEEKSLKTKKLNSSRAKLDLKKEQYQLITSIKLDSCMDLISRFNHLISKK